MYPPMMVRASVRVKSMTGGCSIPITFAGFERTPIAKPSMYGHW